MFLLRHIKQNLKDITKNNAKPKTEKLFSTQSMISYNIKFVKFYINNCFN